MRFGGSFPGFDDREHGARRLAKELEHYRRKPDTIVLGLPRGGVVTAAVVADELELPLDVLIVRKLGTPGQEELAMGAIAPGGVRVLNDDVIAGCVISDDAIERATQRERKELDRRERLYRAGKPPVDVAGKTVIIVDDGLATGSTMAAAIACMRRQNAAHIVVAVPVAPPETCTRFRADVDEMVCPETPEPFSAIGLWYSEFPQVEDEEVLRLLEQHTAPAVAT